MTEDGVGFDRVQTKRLQLPVTLPGSVNLPSPQPATLQAIYSPDLNARNAAS